MKKLFCLIALISTLYLIACNKDDNNPTGKTKQVTGYTTSQYKDTVSFNYNSAGQIIRVQDVEAVFTYDISGNQLHYTEDRKIGGLVGDATFTLDASGKIVSGHGSFSYSTPFTSQFTFTYDGSGNLTNRTDVRSDGNTWSYDYIWTNGDITSEKWNQNGSLYFTEFYEYDSNLADKNKLDGLKFLNTTNSFLGNSNQHLLKRTYSNFAPGTTTVQEATFAFSLDADGYPKNSTITYITTPGTDIVVYYYQ